MFSCDSKEVLSSDGGTSVELVVRRNFVRVGIRGSFSTEKFGNVLSDKNKAMSAVFNIHRLLRVSKIIRSTSQLPTPTPEPPLRERDGRTRFGRLEGVPLALPGAPGVEADDMGAVVDMSRTAPAENAAPAGRLPTAFADGVRTASDDVEACITYIRSINVLLLKGRGANSSNGVESGVKKSRDLTVAANEDGLDHGDRRESARAMLETRSICLL